MVESVWHIAPLTSEQRVARDRLMSELKISTTSASLLVKRGLLTAEQARQFIRPNLSGLHNPFLMRDMDKAIVRLERALEAGEKILVYGDYDVDGTTAVALVYQYLAHYVKSPDKLDYYIPDRYKEGYGISFQGIDYAKEQGCKLIIALDCGIRSVDKVAYAQQYGIDFIICDHHLPGTTLPDAVAVLDAKRRDNTYPFDELSGCGVGFKLMQALTEKRGEMLDRLYTLLPLTAMSIASDIVPIVGENRILAACGIKRLNEQPPIGVQALMEVASLEQGKININDLLFRIGPRINACGRLHSGREAVRLLVTTDIEEARQYANEVNETNSHRRDIEQNISVEALKQLEENENIEALNSNVVCGKGWHKGVVGIVASRLTETYYRPTIVFSEDEEGHLTGSARSVGGFDIYAAIDSCSDLLTNFGGHAFAAGLSLNRDNYEEFKQRFEKYVSEHILPEQKKPVIEVAAELQFADITNQFFKIINCLEPFGPENPRPIFVTRNAYNYRYTRAVGKNAEHLKLDLTDHTGSMQGIAFGKGALAAELLRGTHADILYELQSNTFNGNTTIQMMVQDIRLTPSS